MRADQEALLWRRVEAHYGSQLEPMVKGAVASFRRRPGVNPLTRIHESDVGASAFAVFVAVLPQTGMPASNGKFIHIREQLRSHINYYVLEKLVSDQAEPLSLRDALFSIDLGL